MKKLMIVLLAQTIMFSLAACGNAGGKTDADNDGGSAPAKDTKTVTGRVISAEIPEDWKLVTGDVACGDSSFDFIYCSDDVFTKYFTVIHDTQKVEHYKDMIATGNYGTDLGPAELGEGTWYLAGKVAAGPIGEDTCVIQTYDCDLSSPEIKAVLASLRWVEEQNG